MATGTDMAMVTEITITTEACSKAKGDPLGTAFHFRDWFWLS